MRCTAEINARLPVRVAWLAQVRSRNPHFGDSSRSRFGLGRQPNLRVGRGYNGVAGDLIALTCQRRTFATWSPVDNLGQSIELRTTSIPRIAALA